MRELETDCNVSFHCNDISIHRSRTSSYIDAQKVKEPRNMKIPNYHLTGMNQ